MDDHRVAVRSAAVKSLGVFITNITFGALESSIPLILGHNSGADGVGIGSEVRSENRLKLVTLALLSFNREIMTGVSNLTSTHQQNVVNLTHSVVRGIFDLQTTTDGGDCGKSYFSEKRVPTGNHAQQQLVISAAIDLIASSSLILCPKALQGGTSCFGSSLSSQDSLGRKSFPSEFIEVVLSDRSGMLRVGTHIQDEAQRRLTEKRLTSLNCDVDLSDMADLLLLYVDNDNPLLTLPPALHKSLLLYIPAFEPSDSLSTTAESSSNISGMMHSTNGTEVVPPPYFSSSSNANTLVMPYVLHDEGNASSSLDGITSDSDIDRTKLSALKKNQSRGGSRKQRRVGSTSQTSMMSMMTSDTPDFFATNRSEGDDSIDSRSPAGTINSRSRPFFPSKSVLKDVDDVDVFEGDQDYRRSSMRRSKDKDEFSEFSVLPIRGAGGSFYRTNRPIDTLIEGDGADIDADDDSDHDYEDEMFHDERDSQKAGAEDYHVDVSRGRRRSGEPLSDEQDMGDDSYLQGFGVRTAEERGRSHEMLDDNHHPQRSKSIPYAPNPEAGNSYRSNGMRTKSLTQQGGNQERVGKRSIAIAMSLAKDNKQLASSQSLPCTHLPLDYQELKSSHLLALPTQSWPKGPSSQELCASRRQSSDSDWDAGIPCVQRHPSIDSGHPNVLLESLNSIGFSKKLRTLRSPTITLNQHTIHIAPSSTSPKPSSPLGLFRPNAVSSSSTTKAEIRSKGRDRFKGREEHSIQKDMMLDEEAAGHKEYQLTGETFEYLTTEAIMPSAAPQKDLSKALLGIGTQEWPEIFHTLTTVRRLSLHHSALVVASSSCTNNGAANGAAGGGSGAGRGLHSIVVGVLKQVDNLRSAVAKNALLTLGDLFQGLGKFMDLEVGLALTHVLKRFADSSTFLVESAERALQQMMDGVSPSRSLTGLLTAAEHRAPTVRGKVASVLYSLWYQKLKELRGTCMSGGKEQEVLKFRVGKLVCDQSPEARAASRNLVRFLVKEGVVSKGEWESVISAEQLPKILSQKLTPPVAIGTGSSHRASKPLLFYSAPPSQDMSIDITQDSIFKSRTTGLHNNRHSSSGLARSPPTWTSPYAIEPQVGFPVSADLEDRELPKDKYKGKGDKGVSFATDNDSDSCSYTVQSRKSVSQYTNGASGLSKTSYSNDGSISGLSSGSTKANRRKEMSTASAAKRSMEGPELQVLPELIQTARSSTHWTERQETLKSITELVIVHWKVMLEALRLDLCVDCLLERLEDGSVKVVTCALACLMRIHDEAPGALGHSPALQLVVISALHNTASASNK